MFSTKSENRWGYVPELSFHFISSFFFPLPFVIFPPLLMTSTLQPPFFTPTTPLYVSVQQLGFPPTVNRNTTLLYSVHSNRSLNSFNISQLNGQQLKQLSVLFLQNIWCRNQGVHDLGSNRFFSISTVVNHACRAYRPRGSHVIPSVSISNPATSAASCVQQDPSISI